jgi:hypothetical protein
MGVLRLRPVQSGEAPAGMILLVWLVSIFAASTIASACVGALLPPGQFHQTASPLSKGRGEL